MVDEREARDALLDAAYGEDEAAGKAAERLEKIASILSRSLRGSSDAKKYAVDKLVDSVGRRGPLRNRQSPPPPKEAIAYIRGSLRNNIFQWWRERAKEPSETFDEITTKGPHLIPEVDWSSMERRFESQMREYLSQLSETHQDTLKEIRTFNMGIDFRDWLTEQCPKDPEFERCRTRIASRHRRARQALIAAVNGDPDLREDSKLNLCKFIQRWYAVGTGWTQKSHVPAPDPS